MSRAMIFALFFLATFFQAGAYGLTFLLPPLFAQFGGNEADVGTMLALTAMATLLVVLASGHITARLGRLHTIAAAGLLIGLSLAALASAQQVGVLTALAGIMLGAGWGLFYTLTPVALSQIIGANQRIRFFTLLSVFIMAGFGLTPILGAWLDRTGSGIAAAFWVTAGLCFVAAALFAALDRPFRVQAQATGAAPVSDDQPLSFVAIRRVLQSRAAIPIYMVGLGASVFAAMTNFQVVYAVSNGFDYTDYFIAYTAAVILCRVLFARFAGGRNPYLAITLLLLVMSLSVALFVYLGESRLFYIVGAALFGIGYGVAYPVIKAMAANESDPAVMPQTMQLFGLSYFLGVFGFPFIAGWLIVTLGLGALLITALVLALAETALAARRYLARRRAPDQA